VSENDAAVESTNAFFSGSDEGDGGWDEGNIDDEIDATLDDMPVVVSAS